MQLNLMELCKVYEFPIEGTCGGMALCASCQCYITSKHPLPERSEDEEAMLSEAYNVQENSRLGCQIYLTQGLHGLCMTLAPKE
jgi:2Fe-2S ferredoxin